MFNIGVHLSQNKTAESLFVATLYVAKLLRLNHGDFRLVCYQPERHVADVIHLDVASTQRNRLREWSMQPAKQFGRRDPSRSDVTL